MCLVNVMNLNISRRAFLVGSCITGGLAKCFVPGKVQHRMLVTARGGRTWPGTRSFVQAAINPRVDSVVKSFIADVRFHVLDV